MLTETHTPCDLELHLDSDDSTIVNEGTLQHV